MGRAARVIHPSEDRSEAVLMDKDLRPPQLVYKVTWRLRGG